MSYNARRKHSVPEELFVVVYPDGRSRIYVEEKTAKGEATRYNNWLRKAKEKGVVFHHEGEADVMITPCEWQDSGYRFNASPLIQKEQKNAAAMEAWKQKSAEQELHALLEEFPELKDKILEYKNEIP